MQICVRAHDLGVKGSDNIVKALKDAGADGAQLVCYKSFDDIEKMPGGISQAQAEEIGKKFDEAGLSIQLVGAYFNMVHSDSEKAKTGAEIFRSYLKLCRHLGCKVVGSETGSYNDEPWIYHPRNRTGEALIATTDVFRELCDYAARFDALVAIEGASGHVCWDVETLDKAAKIIDRDNLKIIFDLYNFLDKANCKDYMDILQKGLETFAGRIHCFHIKDCVFRDDGFEQCDVGLGDLDFDEIIGMIKAYDENAVLILEGTKSKSIKRSIEFLRDKWQKGERR